MSLRDKWKQFWCKHDYHWILFGYMDGPNGKPMFDVYTKYCIKCKHIRAKDENDIRMSPSVFTGEEGLGEGLEDGPQPRKPKPSEWN